MAELILRTAVVLGADQSKKLYTVQLCDNPPEIKPAIPLGGLHTFSNDTGAVSFTSYNVGDKVLVVCPDDLWEARSSLCWIFGLLPLLDTQDPPEDLEEYSEFSGILSKLSASLPPLRNDILQIPDFLHGFNAREYAPADLEAGDWSVNGQNTLLSVGDHNVSIKAGKALLLYDAVYNSITESSLFKNTYTAGESSRLQYYLGNLLHTRELSGDFTESCKEDPLFRFQEQLSNVVHGYRRAVVTDGKEPVTLHTEELNGCVNTLGAGIVRIGRSCALPWYTLNKVSILTTNGGEGIHPEDVNKPLQPLDDSDDWDKFQLYGEVGVVYETTFDIASETEWEIPDIEDTSSFVDPYTGEELEVANRDAGLTCLSDGTVLIRDGFGSEIRLCHGNIQISSTNNTTILSGRDILNIAPGMIVSNSGKGIELGSSEGDIAVGAKKAVKVSGNDYTISTVNSTRIVNGKDVTKASVCSLESDLITLVSKRGTISAVAPELRLTGEGQVILSSSQAGFVLSGNALIGGAQVVTIHGNIQVSKGKFTIASSTNSEYESKDIVVPASAATVTVAGQLLVDGLVATNGGLQTADGVCAKFLTLKRV